MRKDELCFPFSLHLHPLLELSKHFASSPQFSFVWAPSFRTERLKHHLEKHPPSFNFGDVLADGVTNIQKLDASIDKLIHHFYVGKGSTGEGGRQEGFEVGLGGQEGSHGVREGR